MSDFEDEDEDLPEISFSQPSGIKSSLNISPVREIEASFTRECSTGPTLGPQATEHKKESTALDNLSPPAAAPIDDEVDEAALSAAVSALRVSAAAAPCGASGTAAVAPRGASRMAERRELLQAMLQQLPDSPDAEFLDAYMQALSDNPEASDAITDQVLQGITVALMGSESWATAGAGAGAGVGATAGVGAWLLCAALTGAGGPARRALQALLERAPPAQVAALGSVCARALGGAARLLRAHDAARSGRGGGADAFASLMLAAALRRLTAPQESILSHEKLPEPLSAEAAARAGGVWRALAPRDQLLLLQAAARALAARGDEGGEGAARAWLAALAQPLPRAAMRLDRLQVLSGVSKLQLLFGARAPEAGDEPQPAEDGDESRRYDTVPDAGMNGGSPVETSDVQSAQEQSSIDSESLMEAAGAGRGEGSPQRKRRRPPRAPRPAAAYNLRARH